MAKIHGIQAFLHDSDLIDPKYKKDWLKALHEPRNFFKHADNDPDKTLEYDAQGLPFLLLEACHLYRRLASDNYLKHRQCQAVIIFEIWFCLAYPKCIKKMEEWHPTVLKAYRKCGMGAVDLKDFGLFKTEVEDANSGLLGR